MADTNVFAYFAGFFDGEGSLGIYHKKYVVTLINTDVRPLRKAKDIWGGAIFSRTRTSYCRNAQDQWRWEIYGHSSIQFLRDIRPFVVIKGEQIDCYLEAMNFVPH